MCYLTVSDVERCSARTRVKEARAFVQIRADSASIASGVETRVRLDMRNVMLTYCVELWLKTWFLQEKSSRGRCKETSALRRRHTCGVCQRREPFQRVALRDYRNLREHHLLQV